MKKQIIIASRYHVIRKIGEGGMAKVYLAYDNIEETNVALKVLRKENVQDKKIKHFKREANALSLMDDENIVKIYDVGEEGDIHYIVNEYIEGMTLKEYISTCSPLPVEEVIEITKQILMGLDHAHKRGVVHKDIKSQNILLNEKKDAKITDFGIADIMDDDATKTQSVMGTPQYVAPEILNREELTEQSDLYSVGILMYEMLVGRAPFSGEKPAVIMIKQMSHPLPSVRDDRPDVPQSLENIIIKASAKTLDNRYKNAEDILYDLETVLEATRANEKKLLLMNDYIDEEKLEKNISLDNELDYNDIKDSYNKEENNKKKRLYIIGGIVGVVVIGIVLAIIFGGSNLTMPDVVGKTQDEATSEILLLNIPEENIEIELVEDEDNDPGTVLSTVPQAGTEIDENVEITIRVSAEKDIVLMGDYVGEQYTAATEKLDEFEIKLQYEYEEEASSDTEAGVILAQNPAPDAELEEGDTVTFTVSTGPEEIVMDNFYGLEESNLDDFEDEYGVTITRNYECSDIFEEEGIVMKQEPGYETVINPSSEIVVSISDGNACTTEVEEAEPEADTTESDTTEADTTETDSTETDTTETDSSTETDTTGAE